MRGSMRHAHPIEGHWKLKRGGERVQEAKSAKKNTKLNLDFWRAKRFPNLKKKESSPWSRVNVSGTTHCVLQPILFFFVFFCFIISILEFCFHSTIRQSWEHIHRWRWRMLGKHGKNSPATYAADCQYKDDAVYGQMNVNFHLIFRRWGQYS